MGLEHPDILRKPPEKLPAELKESLEMIQHRDMGTIQDKNLDILEKSGHLNAEDKFFVGKEKQWRAEADLKLDEKKFRSYTHVGEAGKGETEGKYYSPLSKEEIRENRKMFADGTETRETREKKLEELDQAEDVKQELQREKMRRDPNSRVQG